MTVSPLPMTTVQNILRELRDEAAARQSKSSCQTDFLRG
jgi:hypothetical protein